MEFRSEKIFLADRITDKVFKIDVFNDVRFEEISDSLLFKEEEVRKVFKKHFISKQICHS
jgi:hypothetical protein